MEPPSVRQDSKPPSFIVQQFLDKASQSEDGFDQEGGLVARLCCGCIAVFQNVLRGSKQTSREPNGNSENRLRNESLVSLERSYGRLKLWSDGHGIAAGKFDEVFDKSKSLRRATLKLLTSISYTLVERLVPIVFSEQEHSRELKIAIQDLKALHTAAEEIQSDEDSNSSTDDDPDSETIGEVVLDLKTDTTGLSDLDPLLKAPILRLDAEEAVPVSELLEWQPSRAYSARIGVRFPQADDALVCWLGKANYMRYLRCQEERDGHANAALEYPTVLANAGSEFHDSGLGSSLPPTLSYAETVMSYGPGGGQSVRIPPLTGEAKSGKPFTCVACGKSVSIRNNSLWKRHLYEDLRPWMCLDTACSFRESPFATRQDWISHLAFDHKLDPLWESFECQLCLEATGSGRAATTKHLETHLEEISIAALPLDFDLDVTSDRSQTDGGSGSSVGSRIESGNRAEGGQAEKAPLARETDGRASVPDDDTDVAPAANNTGNSRAVRPNMTEETLELHSAVREAERDHKAGVLHTSPLSKPHDASLTATAPPFLSSIRWSSEPQIMRLHRRDRGACIACRMGIAHSHHIPAPSPPSGTQPAREGHVTRGTPDVSAGTNSTSRKEKIDMHK